MDYTVTLLRNGVNYEVYNETTNPYGIRNMCAGQGKKPASWSKVSNSIKSALCYTKHISKPADAE